MRISDWSSDVCSSDLSAEELAMPHFLDLESVGATELRRILAEASRRKAARGLRPKGAADDDAPLSDHVLAAIFEKSSTRPRVSFDMAMRQLGGASLILSSADMQLGRGATIADTARLLSRFVDLVGLLTVGQARLVALEIGRAASR